MKKRTFRCGLLYVLLLSTLSVFAQTKPVVAVTELRWVVRLSPAWRSVLSEESFPDYFRPDSLLNQQVTGRVQQLVQAKWNAEKVLVESPGAVRSFRTAAVALPPPIFPADRSGADIYVAITQGISLTTTGADSTGMPVRNYNLICQVRAEDKSGKPVWQSRISIPFGTYAHADGVHGQAELSGPDTGDLFVKALETALQQQTGRLPGLRFFRPSLTTTGTAAGFQPIQMQEPTRDIAYRKGETRQLVYTFSGDQVPLAFEVYQQFIGNAETLTGLTRMQAKITNRRTRQVYDLTAEFNLPEDQLVDAAELRRMPIAVRCTADGLVAGKFTLTHQAFEGEWGYDVYQFRRTQPKYTSEVRLNDKLALIFQKGGLTGPAGDRTRATNLLLRPAMPSDERADLLTILLIYHLASAFGQEYLGY